jgi:LytR cell envelope-related transcriptional attenuator
VPAEPGPAVEHAHPIDREASWRGAVPALALVVAIALLGLGGWALSHRLAGTRRVAGTGHVQKQQSSTGTVLRPRAATSVLVLNGNGIGGAAGGVSSRLLADGYRSAPTANAQVMTYARSLVLYRPGWEREARRLAKGTHIAAVAPLDGPLPAIGSPYQLVAIVGH